MKPMLGTNKKRMQVLLSTLGLLMTFTVFAVTNDGHQPKELTFGDSPTYTITLDETNAPSGLTMDTFGSAFAFGRYVKFNYTQAKRALSQHTVLDIAGTLSNDSTTRITSMKSLTATFTGGEATLLTGPTITTLGNSQALTSGLEVLFGSDPYFFSITNSGETELSLTSLEITYSCVHVHSTMSFETNHGSAIAPVTQTIGSELDAPTDPTRTGYTFLDWYSDAALTIPYSFTVMPDADLTIYAKWTVDPLYPVLTIAEFKALTPEDEDLHFVTGTVLLCSEAMEIVIISDSTDTLIAFGYEESAVGDIVRVGGYYGAESGLEVMNGDLANYVSVDVYSSDNEITLSPTSMTVAEYNLLDAYDPDNWVVYAEISGTISVDNENHTISLVDGEDSMFVGVFTQEEFMNLADYDGFDVKIRGVILPNMDLEPTISLMFLFNDHQDFIELDYESDAALLAVIENIFRGYYEAETYFPGQYLDLPTEHPIVSITVDYVLEGANADKYDLNTHRFDSDISTALIVDLNVTITLNETLTEHEFDIDLHVDPDVIITVAELMALPDSQEDALVIHVVVLNVQTQGETLLLLVADVTGIIYVNTDDEGIVPGDEIVAIGYKITYDTTVFLMNDPSRTVDHVRAHAQAIPIAPTSMDLDDFNALDPSYVAQALRYYELSGTLGYTDPDHPESSGFYLTDGTNNVIVYATSTAARTILADHVSDSVTICGLALMAGSPGSQMLVLAYLAYSGITVNE